METIDEGTYSYVGSSVQTIKPLFDIQSFPLHILPIFIIDTLLSLVIFLFCGYDGILDFIIRSAQGSFSESLFDLAVLCVIRNFYLILITWRLRNINGIHIILRVIMLLLVVFSITYTVTKIILTFDVMEHVPGIISLNYTFLALCLVMSIVEFPIVVIVLRKNKQLITEFGFLSLSQEEEEDDCVIKREIIKEGAKHSSFSRVLKMAKQEVPLLLGGMVGLLISSLTMLLLPGYFGAIVTAVSTPMEEHIVKQEILNAVIALLVIFVVGGFFTFIRGWLFTLAGHRVVRRLRKQLFNIISVKDIAYFDKNRTGELTNRLTSDTQLLQDTVTVNISMVVRNLVQVVGGIAFMFVISWKLSLVMLGAVPVVVIAAVLYGGYVRNLTVKFQEMLAHSTSTAEEAISNIRTVKSFSHEKKTQQEYEKNINKSLDIGKSLSLASGLFIGLVSIFSQGAIIVVVWFGGSLVLSKEMNAGTLMAFLIYTLTTAVSFAATSGMFGEVMKAIGAAERIFQLVDDVPLIPISGGKRLNLVKGFIKFTDISFAYPSKQDTPTLKNINLDLSSGEVVALVGPSGGGKSTIVSLIERFYDPDSGTVTLDGCNIKELDPEWYHLQIGYVSQEPVLFGCSIRDNIILGNENITQEQVELAAKKANAEEFISKLEKGYDTMVGERGVLLSGGQKQRVAIARALVLNPKILLFDEATSALDAESEHLVQEAIDKAMEDRTVLIIAHRLSTVRNASKVVVVVNGMIKEEGTHDQLMEKGGIYKKLVKRQLAK